MLKALLLVGSGGFIGSISRYFLQTFVSKQINSDFPWGTFLVNILGCFIIGCVYALAEKFGGLSNEIRMLFAVGFCGGFTTFSSFAMDKLVLLQNGNVLQAIGYITISVSLGLVMVWVGVTCTKALL